MYAVWSRQDAGTQWRAKAGGRENAGTVVPRVSPAGRQGQAMEDIRIRYSTGPREGAGVVQGMAGEEQARTEQGEQQGKRPGKPRAVLGRRVEPYSEDIEGFIEICKEAAQNEITKGSEQKKDPQNYVDQLIRRKGGSTSTSSDKLTVQDYVFQSRGDLLYQNSVNRHIKKKILEKRKDAEEYRRRVLDVKYWNIDKNREWLNTGRVAGYESNDTNGAASIGIENGGQFRLVGLEKDHNVYFEMDTMNTGYQYKKDRKNKNRSIKFYNLRQAKFVNDNQKTFYQEAFQNKQDIPSSNFIAYVVRNLQTDNLLYNNKQSGTKKRFPTVLAQEMEQLDEANYRFATISEDGKVKKVIALPEGAVEDIQKEGAQTTSQQTPSESPESGAMQARSWRRSRTRPVSADPTDP